MALQTGRSSICKKIAKKYQTSGAGGTRSRLQRLAVCKMQKWPPRGPKMADGGLERCLPIDQLLLNMFFDPSTSSVRKSCNGEKEWKKIMENKIVTT